MLNWEMVLKTQSAKQYIDNYIKEMREMFNEYVSALSGQNKEKEIVKEEMSEEDLDSLPISNTKH